MTQEQAEFVGFLMGEGCFTLIRANKKWSNGRMNFKPTITVSARDDDAQMLEWIKERYGGIVSYLPARKNEIRNQNPYARWEITSAKLCKVVLDICKQAKMPTKKMREIELLSKVCDIKVKAKPSKIPHQWYTDEEYKVFEDARQELKRLKVYRAV